MRTKFGTKSSKQLKQGQGPRGVGFKIDSEGNYDMQNKRLSNVGDSVKPSDAVNLATVTKHIAHEDFHKEFRVILQQMADNITRAHETHLQDYNQLVLRVNNEQDDRKDEIIKLKLMIEGFQTDLKNLFKISNSDESDTSEHNKPRSRRRPPVE